MMTCLLTKIGGVIIDVSRTIFNLKIFQGEDKALDQKLGNYSNLKAVLESNVSKELQTVVITQKLVEKHLPLSWLCH
jgi:predicted AAA+ superfamily ATPase